MDNASSAARSASAARDRGRRYVRIAYRAWRSVVFLVDVAQPEETARERFEFCVRCNVRKIVYDSCGATGSRCSTGGLKGGVGRT